MVGQVSLVTIANASHYAKSKVFQKNGSHGESCSGHMFALLQIL